MLDLRRALSKLGLRAELPGERRASSLWIPALSAAAAARECEGEWVDGEAGLEPWAIVRVLSGEIEGEREEGGRELMSGMLRSLLYVDVIMVP